MMAPSPRLFVVFLTLFGIAFAVIYTPDAPQTKHPDFLATLWASEFESGPSQGAYPIGMASHPDGSMYIVNMYSHALSRFSTAVGGTEADNKIGYLQQVNVPCGMKFSADGTRLFVAQQSTGLVSEHRFTGPNIGERIGVCSVGTTQTTDLQIDPLSGDIFVSSLGAGQRVYRISSMFVT